MSLLGGNEFIFDEHIPYYLQLKSVLEEKIDKRELRPGDRLPSEAEICEELIERLGDAARDDVGAERARNLHRGEADAAAAVDRPSARRSRWTSRAASIQERGTEKRTGGRHLSATGVFATCRALSAARRFR